MGARGTPEDTPPGRFGTMRPRVLIPGPDQNLISDCSRLLQLTQRHHSYPGSCSLDHSAPAQIAN